MHTKTRRVRAAGLALACILLVGGCGADNGNAVSDGDKESPVDVVSAERTSTGNETPSQATSPPPPDVAKGDVAKDIVKPDRREQLIAGEAKTNRVPASYLEAVSAIDLCDFPRPDDAAKVEASALRLYFATGATSDEAAEFGKSNLSAAGWKHNPELDKSYGDDHFLWFEEQGFVCSLSALSGEETRVTIENYGNIDARELPRMADAKFKFEGPASVFYSTKNSAEETVKYLLSELKKDGWVRSDPVRGTVEKQADSPDQASSSFAAPPVHCHGANS